MHDNEFTITMKALEKGPVTLHVDCAPARLELKDPQFGFVSPVVGEVGFSLANPRVIATGTLETDVTTQCVRCLGDASLHVVAPVHTLYENEKLIRDSRSEQVSPEEEVAVPFNGDWIQPEDELREAIMLELPSLPLCDEACKGLCPKCGINLNEGTCNCSAAIQEENESVSPWKTALKGLKLNDK